MAQVWDHNKLWESSRSIKRFSQSPDISRHQIRDSVSLRNKKKEWEAILFHNLTRPRLQGKIHTFSKKKRSNIHTSQSRVSRIRPWCCTQMSSAIRGKNMPTTAEAQPPTSDPGQELDQLREQADHPQEEEAEAPSMVQKGISTSKSITIQEFRAVIESKLTSTSLSALLLSVWVMDRKLLTVFPRKSRLLDYKQCINLASTEHSTSPSQSSRFSIKIKSSIEEAEESTAPSKRASEWRDMSLHSEDSESKRAKDSKSTMLSWLLMAKDILVRNKEEPPKTWINQPRRTSRARTNTISNQKLEQTIPSATTMLDPILDTTKVGNPQQTSLQLWKSQFAFWRSSWMEKTLKRSKCSKLMNHLSLFSNSASSSIWATMPNSDCLNKSKSRFLLKSQKEIEYQISNEMKKDSSLFRKQS